jgi:hypothetical protein
MRVLTTIATITVLNLLLSFSLKKKVFFIYIKHELDIAKAIQTVTIYNYTDSTMSYRTAKSNKTLIIKSKRGRFLDLKKASKISVKDDLKQEFGGKWPTIGQSVLMVIDSTNSVKLFAFRVDNDYRFWDPNSIPFANSIFFIPKEKPFKQLPICLQIPDDKSGYWTCTDGCLVDAKAIKSRN